MYAANVTTPQLAVLEFVRRPHTVSAIANEIGLSRPATSQMLNKLVRRRLVRRSEGTRDRREKSIVLSPTGNALLSRIDAARAARFEASLATLSAAAAENLAVALEAAVDELERSQAPTPHTNRRGKQS